MVNNFEYKHVMSNALQEILNWNQYNKNILYDTNDTIISIFEKIAGKHEYEIAVKIGSDLITYEELNKKANKLACLLRQEGVNTNDVIGIIAERSIDTIISILGVLKAGGTYLPVNPDLPGERVLFMLKDSNARVLLKSTDKISCQASETATIYFNDERLASMPSSNLTVNVTSQDGAYIIYTSGTTGLPKGALIIHENIVRLLFNDSFQFDFSHRDKWTLFHSFGFDFSVWEMYGALLRGGELILVPKEEAQDTKKFIKTIKKEAVTVLNQTPTAFYNLSNEARNSVLELTSLRYIIFGGEELKPAKLSYWHHKYADTKLINMYGITETTVHVTYKEIGQEEIESNICNIGKAIPTTSLYLMNEDMQLQPVSEPGELYIGGKGVSKGYVNRDDLNREKFVTSPFDKEERLYKSGDLGKWLPNGDVVFLGRKDKQVQIRGFRVEMGEIEYHLSKYDHINEVLVIDKIIQDEKYIIAYYTSSYNLLTEKLRKYLLTYLPEYMVPSYFIRLNKFPLTTNGKLDKEQLPVPSDVEYYSSLNYVKPESEIEKQVYHIWKELLLVKDFGITDNFFDLGGNSLSLLNVNDRINEQFNLDIPYIEFFKHTTIKSIVDNLIINNKEKKEETNFSYMENRASATLDIINKIKNDQK